MQIIVTSMLMLWAFAVEGTESRFDGPPIEQEHPSTSYGDLRRKFVAEPLVAEETDPRKSPLNRPVFEGLLKPGDPCHCSHSNASDVIRGVDFNASSGVVIVTEQCGFPIVILKDLSWVAYFNVNFGTGFKALHANLSNRSPPSTTPFTIYFYLDFPHGQPFATFNIQPTGDWCSFLELDVFVATIPKGFHNLYIASSCDPNPDFSAFGLDQFYFDNEL